MSGGSEGIQSVTTDASAHKVLVGACRTYVPSKRLFQQALTGVQRRVTQGGPLLPRIFNAMVGATVREWP